MDNSDTNDTTEIEEERIAILLRAAGTRKQLPQNMQAVWAAGFRKELELNRTGRRNRIYKIATLCATVVLSLAVVVSYIRTPVFPSSIVVLRSHGESSIASEEGEVKQVLIGQTIEDRSLLSTAKNSHLSIQYRNYTIRMNADTHLQVLENHLRLRSGQIYVSSAPESKFTNTAEIPGLSIHTPLATITDIGTQFTVDVTDNNVTSVVREGVIQVNTEKTRTSAKAAVDMARKIVIDEDQRIVNSTVSAHGDSWDWIYEVAEPFQTTGHNYYDYFVWCAAEAGLTLEFENQAAKRTAQLDRPNGGETFVHPLKSLESINTSMPDFSAKVIGNTLLVSKNK